MVASSYCEKSRAKRSMSRRASANQVQGMECEDEVPAGRSTQKGDREHNHPEEDVAPMLRWGLSDGVGSS